MNLRPLLTTLLIVFYSLIQTDLVGQGFYNSNMWRKQRNELNFSVGVTNFLGDLGGRDMIGSNFIWDLEISKTRPAIGFNYLYYLGRSFAIRPQISFGKVAGDDKLTQESFRNNRNLNFESIILEGALTFEWQFLKEKVGNIYNLKSNTGKKLGLKSFSLGFYATFGVGGFFFNPKAVGPDGVKYELHPLRTEGQGLEGGADPYKRISVCIPIGFGVRKSINRNSGFKVELTHRFTFTDYIDDVSTVYYNRNVLTQEFGPLAGYFSNPQLGNKPAYVTRQGQQRGDPSDRDGYMYFMVSYYYKISSKSGVYGRNKVRRIKASF
jgi:hypothetical protein